MNRVLVLHHSYELDYGDETKLIGVYTTAEAAAAAMERLKTQPGFRDRPDAFAISAYELDKDHWTEGFASVIMIEVEDDNGNWVLAEAEALVDGTYQIMEQPPQALTSKFRSLDIVRCIETGNRLRAVDLVRRP